MIYALRYCIFGVIFCRSGMAGAQTLGGAESPQISLGHIALMFVLCVMIAVLAIFLLRRYVFANASHKKLPGAGPHNIIANYFSSKGRQTNRSIDIVSSRKVAQHCDVTIIYCADREYVLASGPSQIVVLSEKKVGSGGSDASV